MKRTGSNGYFFLSATFILLAVLWFFWLKNRTIAIVWFCTGIAELCIAVVARRKERNGK